MLLSFLLLLLSLLIVVGFAGLVGGVLLPEVVGVRLKESRNTALECETI